MKSIVNDRWPRGYREEWRTRFQDTRLIFLRPWAKLPLDRWTRSGVLVLSSIRIYVFCSPHYFCISSNPLSAIPASLDWFPQRVPLILREPWTCTKHTDRIPSSSYSRLISRFVQFFFRIYRRLYTVFFESSQRLRRKFGAETPRTGFLRV